MLAAPAAAQYGYYGGYGYTPYGGSYTGRRLLSEDTALPSAIAMEHIQAPLFGRTAGRSLLQTYGSPPSGYYYYGYGATPAGPAYGRRRLLQATPAPAYGGYGYGYGPGPAYGYGY